MKFLYKLFIKDYKNTKDNEVRKKYGILAGVIGIILNLFLSSFKLVVGFIANSVSLIGDGVNNLSDTLSSIINVFSFKINGKPADKEHPYGHQRSEYVGGLLISILIIAVAVELLTSSIEKIIHPQTTIISFYLLIILVINLLIKTFMAILYNNSAKAINSLSLKASYHDSLNDILMTLIIVIGLYSSSLLHFDLDGYLGVVLAIFIIISGIKLIRSSINKLLGEPLDEESINTIINDILENPEILGVHDVLTHKYGESKVFMSLHAEISANHSLLVAHEIIDNLERKIKKVYGVDLLIHIDPVELHNKELIKIKELINKTLLDIDKNLSSHDVHLTKGNNKTLYFDLVMPYSYQARSKEILDIVIDEIKRNCKYTISIEINYK